ncbi:phage portal protein, lambda family [Stappia sp. 22II-S9-Z10]|nr:phage portal protein, lambda family [Stappia sp. 22II-S9-Z10]
MNLIQSALRAVGLANVPQPSASYLRGLPETAPTALLHLPVRPSLRSADTDVRVAWAHAAARAVEACHNNGWISGVVNTLTSLMVGEQLRPNLRPDFSWAGWDEKQAAEWARLVERRFSIWASSPWECDAGGRRSLGQMQAAVVRSWFGSGDAVAQIPMIDRVGSTWRTKMRLIPPHQLVTSSDPMQRLNSGVYLDGDGAPAGYLLFQPDLYGQHREVRAPARDGFGRPMMVHMFDGEIGAVRGITPFAPILRVLRNYDQLSDATLTAAMIHAIFAATIESDYPTGDVLDALKDEDEQRSDLDATGATRFDEWMGQKIGWHQNVDIDLGRHGKIAHLMSGEHLKLHSSEHPNSTYEAFANFLLREIAACAGATFEDMTGDYRGATYSSIRMGIAKQWPGLLYRRRHVPVPFSQAALDAFIEEEVDTGAVPFPGGIAAFVEHKAEVCRAEWRGPAKPQADEVKAQKAHEGYRKMGVMTDEHICAELGTDYEDVYRQRAFEREQREAFNIHGGITNGGTDSDRMDEIGGADPGAEPGSEE